MLLHANLKRLLKRHGKYKLKKEQEHDIKADYWGLKSQCQFSTRHTSVRAGCTIKTPYWWQNNAPSSGSLFLFIFWDCCCLVPAGLRFMGPCLHFPSGGMAGLCCLSEMVQIGEGYRETTGWWPAGGYPCSTAQNCLSRIWKAKTPHKLIWFSNPGEKDRGNFYLKHITLGGQETMKG